LKAIFRFLLLVGWFGDTLWLVWLAKERKTGLDELTGFLGQTYRLYKYGNARGGGGLVDHKRGEGSIPLTFFSFLLVVSLTTLAFQSAMALGSRDVLPFFDFGRRRLVHIAPRSLFLFFPVYLTSSFVIYFTSLLEKRKEDMTFF
jgi:hypothetical protein